MSTLLAGRDCGLGGLEGECGSSVFQLPWSLGGSRPPECLLHGGLALRKLLLKFADKRLLGNARDTPASCCFLCPEPREQALAPCDNHVFVFCSLVGLRDRSLLAFRARRLGSPSFQWALTGWDTQCGGLNALILGEHLGVGVPSRVPGTMPKAGMVATVCLAFPV